MLMKKLDRCCWFSGICGISECGCPGAYLESWCDETKTNGAWCSQSESNCAGCHGGVWCTGAASDDTESSGIVILFIKS